MLLEAFDLLGTFKLFFSSLGIPKLKALFILYFLFLFIYFYFLFLRGGGRLYKCMIELHITSKLLLAIVIYVYILLSSFI